MGGRANTWRRIGIIAAIVIAVVIVAAWLVLRSGTFQRYVIRQAESSATGALGVPVHIAGMHVHAHSFTPSVDIYGLVVAGRAVSGMATPKPLASIAHVHVAVRIDSLIERKFQIQDVEVERPSVQVYVNARGDTNLPQPASEGPNHGPDIFALGIRRAVVRNGEISINDRAQQVTADVRDAKVAVGYESKTQSYTGNVSYGSGRVQVGDLPAITTGLAMEFTAGRDGVRIPSLVLTSEGVRVNAQATVSDYADPEVAARYRVEADVTRLRAALRLPALPEGAVQINGTAEVRGGQLSAAGRFASAELQLRAGALAASVRELQGAYQFADGRLSASGIRAQVLGGGLEARVAASDLGPEMKLDVQAQLRGAQLGQIARLEPKSRKTLEALGIRGTVGATIRAEASKGLDSLRVQADTTLAATLGGTPVNGRAQVVYAGDELTIADSRARTPHASVRMTGGIRTQPGAPARLSITAQSSDLTELEALVGRVAAALGQPLPALGLAGTGRVTAAVTGTLASPAIRGQVEAAGLRVKGTAWKRLEATFAASASQVEVSRFSLQAAQPGSITAQGSVALQQWTPKPESAVNGTVKVTGLRVAQLAPLVEALQGGTLPVSGILDVQATATGTVGAPEGKGSATLRGARLEVGDVDAGLESAEVQFHATRETVTAQMGAQLAAGTMTASGTWQIASGAYTARLHAAGLDLTKLPPVVATRLGIRGRLALDGQGQGTMAAPEFTLRATAPTLEADGQTIRNLDVQVKLAGQELEATLGASSLETPVTGKAAITLTGNWPATATLDAPAIPLAPVLAAFAPQVGSDVTGQTALRAQVQGPLRAPEQLQVAVTVPKLEMRYTQALEVHATAPIEVQVAHGVVTLAPAEFIGSGTDFKVRGTVPVSALGATAGAGMQVSANGTINLKLAEAFVPELASSGTVTVQVQAAGTLAKPAVTGLISLSDVNVSNPGWPVAVQRGQGALRLHDGRLDLTGFTADVGGGQLTVGGGMTITPAVGFNFSIVANQIRLRYPPGLREVVGANLNMTGTPAAGLLSGRVQVESVATAPGFDFAALTSELAQQTVAVATPGSFLNDLRLEIAVTTPNQVSVVSRDFSIHANANVNVRGTAQEPVVLGRVDLDSGDLIFRGNRYVISAGTMDFVNPIRTVPTVNVTADTTIQQYDLHLHFQGPVDNLRTSYTSDPSLPPADIINLLAFGTTTEASAANPLPGNLGAENLVASAVTSQITDRVEKIAGISHLSVDPVLGGGQQNAGARITLQQRVTGNLYVTISTDVTSTQRNVIEIQYKLSPKVSVSGVRKQNGGFGANLQFKKVWH